MWHSPALPCASTHERSSGPSHHRGFCCPVGSSGNTAASDAHPAGRPLPGSSPVIGLHPPTDAAAPVGPGRASPVPAATIRTFHALYAGKFLGAALQALHPFHGLRRDGLGSALPPPHPKTGTLTARQASLDAADRSIASPEGLLTLGFDPTRFQTEPPACYRASWQLPGPDSHRQATTSLCQTTITSSTSDSGRTPTNCVGMTEKERHAFNQAEKSRSSDGL